MAKRKAKRGKKPTRKLGGFFDWLRGSSKAGTEARDYCVIGQDLVRGKDHERCGLTKAQATNLFRAARAQAKRLKDVNVIMVERGGKALRCPYWEDDRTDRNCG